MLTISMGMNIFPLYRDPATTLSELRAVGFGGVDFNYTDYSRSPDLKALRFEQWLDALAESAEAHHAFHDRPPASFPVILQHAYAVARVILQPLDSDRAPAGDVR